MLYASCSCHLWWLLLCEGEDEGSDALAALTLTLLTRCTAPLQENGKALTLSMREYKEKAGKKQTCSKCRDPFVGVCLRLVMRHAIFT